MSKLRYILLIAVMALLGQASANVVSFEEQYQDYNGYWHNYNSSNLLEYPMFLSGSNDTDYLFYSWGDTVIIPKTMDVILTERKISPSMTFPKTQLVSRMINYNTTVAYLVFPYSLSRVKDFSDEHNIWLGRWHFDTSIAITDSNGTTLDTAFYDFKIMNDEIRLYFVKSEANKLVGDITFKMNSWTIDNATTAGFTTSNVSLNGSSWTGQNGGGLRLNYRNDSSLNMSGLVAAWNFDSESGTIAHNVMNESGLVNITNQGTINNFNTGLNNCTNTCSGWNSSGVIGNALAFDGVNDYVDAGNDASISMFSALSFGGWIKISNTTTQGNIISKDDTAAQRSYYIRWHPANTFSSRIWTTGGNKELIFPTVPALNEWVYLLSVYDGSNLKIYYNGVLVGISGSLTGTVNISSISLKFGASKSTTMFFNGSIDEVRIYNRALSASEIAVLYNTSLRSQAVPVFDNQSASAGNVINRTRIIYTGQDSINNASIYARQNGTTSWNLIQSNATLNTWYPITNQFSSMDFAVLMQGNGSNTPFFTSLEWDETTAEPASFTHTIFGAWE